MKKRPRGRPGHRRGKKGATVAQRQGRRHRPSKRKLGRRKLTPEEARMEARRTQAIALYRTGKYSQQQIAEMLGVNQSTICKDLNLLLHERYPAIQEESVETYREREIQVADRVAEASWEAWDQSGLFGPDSRHLRNVLAASVQRCKVQGTYAPTKVSATVDLSELLGRAIDDEHGAHTQQ